MNVETQTDDSPATMLLSVDETSKMLGIGRTMLYQLIRSGDLRSLCVGRRRLIPRSELDRFVAEAR